MKMPPYGPIIFANFRQIVKQAGCFSLPRFLYSSTLFVIHVSPGLNNENLAKGKNEPS